MVCSPSISISKCISVIVDCIVFKFLASLHSICNDWLYSNEHWCLLMHLLAWHDWLYSNEHWCLLMHLLAWPAEFFGGTFCARYCEFADAKILLSPTVNNVPHSPNINLTLSLEWVWALSFLVFVGSGDYFDHCRLCLLFLAVNTVSLRFFNYTPVHKTLWSSRKQFSFLYFRSKL